MTEIVQQTEPTTDSSIHENGHRHDETDMVAIEIGRRVGEEWKSLFPHNRVKLPHPQLVLGKCTNSDCSVEGGINARNDFRGLVPVLGRNLLPQLEEVGKEIPIIDPCCEVCKDNSIRPLTDQEAKEYIANIQQEHEELLNK